MGWMRKDKDPDGKDRQVYRGGKSGGKERRGHSEQASDRMNRRVPPDMQWEIPPDFENEPQKRMPNRAQRQRPQKPTVWELGLKDDSSGQQWEDVPPPAGRRRSEPNLWEMMGEEDAYDNGYDDPYYDDVPQKGRGRKSREKPRKAPKRKAPKAPRAKARRPRMQLNLNPFGRGRRGREDGEVAVKRRWTKKRVVATLIFGLIALLVALAVLIGIFWLYTTRNDELWLDLDQIPYRTETILYTTDQQSGETSVYATLPCTQNKEYVPSEQIPQQLRQAFVAVEDKTFYSHGGVNITRTAFAVFNEMKFRITGSYIGGDEGRKQGASTIDQQLIKNLTRDDDDSNMSGYLRKLREVYRAWKLEAHYEKDEILDAYLNTISFTGNTAGVQAEAKKQFGKTVDQLSLPECASLAAITRNPARYNPATHPEEHKERRDYVLGLMLEEGYISQTEHDAAVATSVSVTGNSDPKRPQYVTSYFTDAVMDEVVAEFVDQRGLSRAEASNLLYNGGLRIYTTVVPELQSAMEATMTSAVVYPRPGIETTGVVTDAKGIPVLDDDGNQVIGDITEYPQAAMVSLDYNGGLSAVVGGLGEKTLSRGFNRGMNAQRQVGSTMKPIGPYAVAFRDDKITWSSPFLDAPVREIEDEKTGKMIDWPSNVTNTYTEQDILVREALAQSVNTIAVRVGEEAGIRKIYNFVRNDLGISSVTKEDNDPGPMVLGSSTHGITPVEMAKAYAMLGNGGYVSDIHSFTDIKSGTGTLWLENEYATVQVLDTESAYILNRLMKEVVNNGTAAGMSVPGELESVGKTGTTSDNRDHWFVGLTPYYVTASWYGYDSNETLLASNSSHPPTLAWRQVMQQAQSGLPYKEFPSGGNVVIQNYCTVSGSLAGSNCPSAQGIYKSSHGPAASCPVHGG